MGSIDKEIQLDSMVFIRDYGFRRCFTPEYQSGTTSQTAAQFGTTASEGASRLSINPAPRPKLLRSSGLRRPKALRA